MNTYFKNLIKIFIFLSVCLLLNGCSIPKATFDCQYGKGVGCRSITQVNEMVNNNSLDNPSPAVKKNVAQNTIPTSQEIISTDTAIVQRVTEEHLRVWIAPFQDEQGHFHEASIIHTVLRPGFWQVQEGF